MNKSVLSVLAAGALSLVLSGCGESSAPDADAVSVSGSTSVTELMEVLGEHWHKQSKVIVEVQGTGSSAGIHAANQGTSHIGMSSREVAGDELVSGVTTSVLAYDGIAVVVNSSNTIAGLSTAQVAAIYRGEASNWQDVGGEDLPIVLVTRDPASGTRVAFEDIMGLKAEDERGNIVSTIARTAQVAPGNGAVKMTVAQNSHAIGYISLGSVDGSLKSVSIDGIEASMDTIADKSYKIIRPFVLMHAGQEASKNSEAFLTWLLSDEAQNIVSAEGYIPAN
ncbi:phosphate ABC transporter substrate-binding protein [Parendozoicomonas haliclonae]|uniref:Phosphate-binding protein n=1 Tax=Parendozoicomonas haliclonae TaxID=1960125 RepID=A0A1X7AFS2_9GAMM|nr:phosphate ABC transporter substrate-binding protein [Parendozoicomonas haliclonae]SMA37393.1 Phosphate-binding protein PstS 1 precursor [Parendozoicomonas haliclonae]